RRILAEIGERPEDAARIGLGDDEDGGVAAREDTGVVSFGFPFRAADVQRAFAALGMDLQDELWWFKPIELELRAFVSHIASRFESCQSIKRFPDHVRVYLQFRLAGHAPHVIDSLQYKAIP